MALGVGATQKTSSLFALNAMRAQGLSMQKNLAQLSSGNRLVNGSIDPSGLAISQGMRAQISGYDQAIYNAQDTVNLTRTADSTLANQGDTLTRMRDLAVRASNDATLTQDDRDRLNAEFQSLSSELTRSGQASTFNGKQLTTDVAGQEYGTQAAQVGPNNGPENQIDVTINPSTAATLGPAGNEISTQDISSTAGAQAAIDAVDTAINDVSNQRASLGIQEDRLQYATNDLNTARINVAAANSRIADTDYAGGITDMMQTSLKNKFSMAALSQSNAQAYGVLKLLGQ